MRGDKRHLVSLPASRIVVLDKGSIVEEGRHDELLAKGGLYSRLYEMTRAPVTGTVKRD